MWRCGGGHRWADTAAPGAPSGASGAEQDQVWPPRNFGPDSMNLVGVQTQDPSQLDPAGRWFEAIPPGRLFPADLHAAQLARRHADQLTSLPYTMQFRSRLFEALGGGCRGQRPVRN